MQFIDVLKQLNIQLLLIESVQSLTDYAKVDLSEDALSKFAVNPANQEELQLYLSKIQQKEKAKVLYGGYLEKRNLYANSTLFNSNQIRNIHLGLDFWAEAGTAILAPLDGIVHSAHYNEGEGNYGGTIILKHQFKDFSFFSLYGHLSKASLSLKINSKIKKDEVFCNLGGKYENGNYVPHLHFQWILNLPKDAVDYPGVCTAYQIEDFANNSPKPTLSLTNS